MPTLKEAQDKVRELSQKGLEVAEHLTMTAAEKKAALDKIEPDIKTWIDEVNDLKEIAEKRKSFQGYSAASGTGEERNGDAGLNSTPKSLGQQFVESKNYEEMVARGFSGKVDSGDIELKATLTEGTSGSQGGGYVLPNTVPQLLPGILQQQFAPLTIADLIPGGTTDSTRIAYLMETSVVNGADTTGEGQLSPESALTFTEAEEVLHKITTFLPTTEEMLEDFAQIQSYIDARLTLFVKIKEEQQLLTGSGTGNDLNGLMNRSGLATSITKGTTPSVSGDNDMDAIYRQITAIRTTQFLEPDAVVTDPFAWQNILLAKATGTGNYFANGPFLSANDRVMWGKKVVVTPAITTLTALVGCFGAGAQVFRKGGLTVQASNSHADFFQRGKTAIRAVERLALAVYRPGAFGTVTNL